MEQVKRLAGNEIELGMMISMIESRVSNIPLTKEQRMLLCGLTDKDLRRICGNQYEHPCSLLVIDRIMIMKSLSLMLKLNLVMNTHLLIMKKIIMRFMRTLN